MRPRLWIAHLRQTGQHHRLPYWTPLMCEAEDEVVLAGSSRQQVAARDSEAVTGVASRPTVSEVLMRRREVIAGFGVWQPTCPLPAYGSIIGPRAPSSSASSCRTS